MGSNKLVEGENDLKTWCINNGKSFILDEWDYDKNCEISPTTVTYASGKMAWWRCLEGHSYYARIGNRIFRGHGCPYCSATWKKALAGVNDLVTWCKENDKQYILDEWDYELNGNLRPEMFTFGSHKKINWKCKKGHKWIAVIKNRTRYKGNMCPECKNSLR